MGGFSAVSRTTLDTLYQSYRVPGILPVPVPATNNHDEVDDISAGHPVADEFIQAVPFVGVGDQPLGAHHVARVALGSLMGEEGFLSSAGVTGTDWAAGAASAGGWELDPADNVRVRFKKISLALRADQLMAAAGGAGDDVLQAQVRLASLLLVRELSRAMLQSNLYPYPSGDPGDVGARELMGLPRYAHDSNGNQVGYSYIGSYDDEEYTNPGGAKGMIGGLSHIEALCHPTGGDHGTGPDVFVLSSRARWRLLKEIQDAGLEPDYRHCALTQRVQLHFHGVPVLIGRVREGVVSPQTTLATTEAWAVKLLGPSGVRVLHVGGDPKAFGVRLDEKGPVMKLTGSGSGEATNASRAVEVSGVYSILVPEQNSVARLTGIPAADPFSQAS